MSYTVSSDNNLKITLNESDRVKSILQNITLILRTRQGTIPLYRDFGLPMDFLDRPISAAVPVLIMEVREAFARFEPRAELVSANLKHNAAGILIAELEVNILNEQESGV